MVQRTRTPINERGADVEEYADADGAELLFFAYTIITAATAAIAFFLNRGKSKDGQR